MILEKILKKMRLQTTIVQWNNSSEVIEWFEKIEHKTNKCFIIFDIEKFYPSIKHEQLHSAIKVAIIIIKPHAPPV